MRYKVKAPSEELFLSARDALTRGGVKVYVASPKRLVLSTDDIPHRLRDELESGGIRILPDFAYDVERR